MTAHDLKIWPEHFEAKTTNQGEPMKPQSFWMVSVPDNGSAPVVMHTTLENATAEAERLARKTNKKVYVLKTVALVEVEPAPIKTTKL